MNARSATPDTPSRYDRLARGLALAMLLLANVAVAALAFRDRNGYQFLLFSFWAETLVIGVYNLPKMLIAGGARYMASATQATQGIGAVLLVLAGVAVYALAFAVLMMVLFVGLGMLGFVFLSADSDTLMRLPRSHADLGTAIAGSLVLYAVSHGVSFIGNFLYRREYQRASTLMLALQPFLRIALTVLIGLFGVAIAQARPEIASATLFTAFLVALKLVTDLYAHRAERRRMQQPGAVMR